MDKKQLHPVWREIEIEYGESIPSGIRELVEEYVEPDLRDYDSRNQESLKATMQLITDLNMRAFKLGKYFASRKRVKRSTSKGSRGPYGRPFEKRLYLVEFVVDGHLTIANRKGRSFALRKRINWKRVCAEWNEAHSHDPPMRPDELRMRYYNYIAHENIQREYFARKDAEAARLYEENLYGIRKEMAQMREIVFENATREAHRGLVRYLCLLIVNRPYLRMLKSLMTDSSDKPTNSHGNKQAIPAGNL